MARPRKTLSAEKELKRAEELVLKKKAELDEAVTELKVLREKIEKERQKQILAAVAKSKWSFDKIMEFSLSRVIQTIQKKKSYSSLKQNFSLTL